jgi:hypothetical protein
VLTDKIFVKQLVNDFKEKKKEKEKKSTDRD